MCGTLLTRRQRCQRNQPGNLCLFKKFFFYPFHIATADSKTLLHNSIVGGGLLRMRISGWVWWLLEALLGQYVSRNGCFFTLGVKKKPVGVRDPANRGSHRLIRARWTNPIVITYSWTHPPLHAVPAAWPYKDMLPVLRLSNTRPAGWVRWYQVQWRGPKKGALKGSTESSDGALPIYLLLI